jgi:putative membrane protein
MAPEISARRLNPLSPVASTALALIRAWPVVLLSVARSTWEVLILFIIAIVIWRIAVWSRTYWSLDEAGLVMRSGIWRRQTQTVPPQRVQQIEIRRGLRHRLLGLAVVRVGLAGSGDDNQVELDALRSGEASELQRVLEHWRTLGTQTPAVWPAPTGFPMVLAPAPEAITPPRVRSDASISPAIFEVRTWHLIAAGLSSRTLWVAPIAAIGGALQLSGDLGRGEETRETLRDWVTSSGPLIAVPVIASAAVALAIGSHLVRNHRYRITRHGGEFILSRGLVETRSVTVPQARIQALQITANWIRVILGLATMQIHTADLGPRSAGAVDVPIGSRKELIPLGDRLLGLPAAAIICERHPLAAVRREVFRRVLRLVPVSVIATLAIGGIVRTTPTHLAIAAGSGGLLAVISGILAATQRATGWNDSAIVTRSGFYTRTQWTVPNGRIQSVGSTQNPFQRRLGLMSLRLDVAGTRSGVMIKDLSVTEAERLLAHLDSRHLNARVIEPVR